MVGGFQPSQNYQSYRSEAPQPKAFSAATSTTSSPTWSHFGSSNWYLDSAEITKDISHLDDYHPYSGSEQVTVGNGALLPIHNTGKGLLPTPIGSIRLNYVLHIPSTYVYQSSFRYSFNKG